MQAAVLKVIDKKSLKKFKKKVFPTVLAADLNLFSYKKKILNKRSKKSLNQFKMIKVKVKIKTPFNL